MTDGLPQAPPAGWYGNPENPEQLRWWDGTGWTATVTAKAPGESAPDQIAQRARRIFFWALAAVGVGWVLPILLVLIPTSETQTFGVVLGWIGFLPAIALVLCSIALGAVGLSRSRRLGGLGRTQALTGLIGGIGLIAVPALLTTIVAILVLS